MRVFIKSALGIAALAAGWLATAPALAQSTTFVLSSGAFDVPTQFVSPCLVPTCKLLTTAGVTGTVTLSAPLPADEAVDAGALVTAYSVTAAGLTIESTDPLARMPMFLIVTDAAGGIAGFSLELQRLASTNYLEGDEDSDARLDTIVATSAASLVWANLYCDQDREPDGTCFYRIADDNSSTTLGGPVVLTDPNAVPTLSEWAMILLGLALAGAAILRLHIRQRSVVI